MARHRREAEDVRGSWREDAACLGMDTDLFFPEGRGYVARKQTTAARRVCWECPVSAACLESSLSVGSSIEQWGVRGGLSQDARRTLVLSTQAAADVTR